MGHTQFIPTTYSAYAVDQDGDGKRNIWGDVPDALASTASYLKVSNWKAGQAWGYEVTLPKGANVKKIDGTTRTLADWQKAGVVRATGEPYPRPTDKGTIFAPAGTDGPTFSCRALQRSSAQCGESYALGVGHLSDRLRGGGPACVPGRPTRRPCRAAHRAPAASYRAGPPDRRCRRRHRARHPRSGQDLSAHEGAGGRWLLESPRFSRTCRPADEPIKSTG